MENQKVKYFTTNLNISYMVIYFWTKGVCPKRNAILDLD